MMWFVLDLSIGDTRWGSDTWGISKSSINMLEFLFDIMRKYINFYKFWINNISNEIRWLYDRVNF